MSDGDPRHLGDLLADNARLRAALAQSDQPCAYCTLSREDWAKCKSGFPGCDRADDAMGCPHLGASLEAERYRDALKRIKGELSCDRGEIPIGRLSRLFEIANDALEGRG